MKTLIFILGFFPVMFVLGQEQAQSIKDLYNQSSRIWRLGEEGKSQKVIVLCDSVIKKYENFPGNQKYIGYIYVYMAEAAKHLGDVSLARYAYHESLKFFEPESDMLKFIIPINLIALDLEAGLYNRCLTQGLVLFHENDFRNKESMQGTLLINLTEAAVQLKKFAQADSLYVCLFQLIKKEIFSADFDTALVYRNFGRFMLIKGQLDQAGLAIRRSLVLYRSQVGDFHYQTAKSWNALGNYYVRRNLPDSALYCYRNSKSSLTIQDTGITKNSFRNVRLDYETIYLELLRDQAELHRTLAMKQVGMQRVIEFESGLDLIIEAVNRFNSVMQVLVGTESGFVLANKGRKLFDTGISIAIELYKGTGNKEFIQQAFIWSMQSGSISLESKVFMEERMLADDSIRIWTVKLYQVREALDKKIDQASRERLLHEYRRLTQLLSFDHDRSLISRADVNSQMSQITRSIGRDNFIDYHQQDSTILVFELGRGTLRYSEILITDELTRNVTDLMNFLSNPRSGNYQSDHVMNYFQSAVYLYQVLLKPFIENQSSHNLFIRPDGLISTLPFEALVRDYSDQIPQGGFSEFRKLPFVAKSFCISYVMGVREHFGAINDRRLHKQFCILTCPDDRLAPQIKSEVQMLSSKIDSPELLYIGNSTHDLRASLAKADVIHFSGHIRLDNENAWGTAMACSDQSIGEVPISEILYTWIKSDLVFLNGCESAEGLVNKGDGKLSVGLSFLIAGAGGVIEHRWKASDISGSQLASEFYTNYPSTRPTRALVEAKRQYLKSCQVGLDHPHYWAGMVYSGSLRFQTFHQAFYVLMLIGLILLLTVIVVLIRVRIKHRPLSDNVRMPHS
jgi:hypothetical protein